MDDVYVWTSYLSATMVTVTLGWLFCKRRHMFVRPSLVVMVFFNLRIQWAAAVESPDIYGGLGRPWEFWLLAHVVPWLVLAPLVAMRSRKSQQVWRELQAPARLSDYLVLRQAIHGCLSLFAVLTAYYLWVVPFTHTGLYAIFTDPLSSDRIREQSLKLIPNPLLRYSYSWAQAVIGPLTGGLLTLRLVGLRGRRRNAQDWVIYLVLLAALMVGVSFHGGRGAGATVILACVLTAWIRKGMPVRVVLLSLAILLLLTGPALLTMLREDTAFTFGRFLDYLIAMANRVCVTTMHTALWHVDYAQCNGFVGIQGIRPWALIAGERYIGLSNIVGIIYADSPIDTVTACACFVFDFYACFGLFAIVPAVVCWLGLDLFLVVLRRPSPLNAVVVAVLWLKCSALVSSAFLVNLVTHGVLLLFVIAILLQWRLKKQEERILFASGAEQPAG